MELPFILGPSVWQVMVTMSPFLYSRMMEPSVDGAERQFTVVPVMGYEARARAARASEDIMNFIEAVTWWYQGRGLYCVEEWAIV